MVCSNFCYIFKNHFELLKLMKNFLVIFAYVSYEKFKTLYTYFHKTYNHQTWWGNELGRGALTQKFTCPIVWLRDTTWQNTTLYLHFQEPITIKQRQSCDLGWRFTRYLVTCPFDHVVTWCQVIKLINFVRRWNHRNKIWEYIE